MVVDQLYFDVRLHLDDIGEMRPGETRRVSLTFLDREHAKKHCARGARFVLREVNPIGEGVIVEWLDD